MTSKERKIIGEYLRRIRRIKNLSISGLADENLSTPTISRIENGKSSVSEDKITLYAEKLGCDISDAFNVDVDEQNKLKKLQAIEIQVDLGNISFALKKLKEINCMEMANQAYLHYIRGKAYYYLRKYERSTHELNQVIEIVKKINGEENKPSNILGCTHNILSNIKYARHSIKDALKEIDLALECFEKEGDQYYMALMNKAVYLRKLNRIGDGEDIIDELLTVIPRIKSSRIKTSIYGLKADYEKQKKRYDIAITFVREGISLAVINKIYDRYMEMATVLGDILTEIEEYEEAEWEYLSALSVADKVAKKHVIAHTYTRLGYLYLKTGNMEGSEEKFKEAISLCESDDYVGGFYIDALTGLADLLLSREEKEKAGSYYEQALKLAQEQFLDSKQREIALRLSVCFDTGEKAIYYLRLHQQLCLKFDELGRNLHV